MVVAVKKLHENVGVLSKNFNSEVDCLIEVKHKNIVQFLGYCSDTQKVLRSFQGKNVWAEERQKLLCFEYLSKGSLADYLTGKISHIIFILVRCSCYATVHRNMLE